MISLSTTQKLLLFPLALVLAAAVLLGLVSSAQAASYGVAKETSPRQYVTVPKKIQACTKCQVDARILDNVTYLADKFDLVVTQGRNKYPPSLTHGDGTAVDFVPAPGGSWKKVARAAKLAKKLKAVRDVQYGKFNHLHVSWNNSCHGCGGGKLVKPRKWVKVFTVSRSATRSSEYGPWLAEPRSRSSAKVQARSYLRVTARSADLLVKATQRREESTGSVLQYQVRLGDCLGRALKGHDPRLRNSASQDMYMLGLLQSNRNLLREYSGVLAQAKGSLSKSAGAKKIRNNGLRKGLSGRLLELNNASTVPGYNYCQAVADWKKGGYGRPDQEIASAYGSVRAFEQASSKQKRAWSLTSQGNRAAKSILGASEVNRFDPWYWSASPFYGGAQAWDIALNIASSDN